MDRSPHVREAGMNTSVDLILTEVVLGKCLVNIKQLTRHILLGVQKSIILTLFCKFVTDDLCAPDCILQCGHLHGFPWLFQV